MTRDAGRMYQRSEVQASQPFLHAKEAAIMPRGGMSTPRSRKTLATAIAVVAAAIAVPFSAFANVNLCSSWYPGSVVDVYLNKQSFTALGFNGSAVVELTKSAIEEWNVSGRSDVRLQYLGERNYAVANRDSYCQTNFEDIIIQMNPGIRTGDTCANYALGNTIAGNLGPNPSPATVCVRVWDVTTGTACADRVTEGFGDISTFVTYSLWDTITHELGHALCLPHSNVTSDPIGDPTDTDVNNTMWPALFASTTHRFLKPHDVHRLNVKYGDQVNWAVDAREDADGVGVMTDPPGFTFPGNAQDGVALSAQSNSFYAVWSDPSDGDLIKMSHSQNGTNWSAPESVGNAQGGGWAYSIQVPAITQGPYSYVLVAYLFGAAHGGQGWNGTGREVRLRYYHPALGWSNALVLGESYSGPALAYDQSIDCFFLAFAGVGNYKDRIVIRKSCGGPDSWGANIVGTMEIRSTDRPAIAWGSDGQYGGILWTTNQSSSGAILNGNIVKWGRLRNDGLMFPTVATQVFFAHSFAALAVSDAGAPQPNRWVMFSKYSSDSREQYVDNLTASAWSPTQDTIASQSPPSAAYSTYLDQYWTLYTH